ncbi:uncharacterized protein LOC135165318 [Diachasmimorpha longicaudata]|uniref:uncharacterized protein LOC135165318 n=1 Tax=Diachasmimorpha longicaudata TaxID=58733 RepID=UPI0030B8EDCC
MKIYKTVLVGLLGLMCVNAVAGESFLSTVRNSIVNWAGNIWKVITTGTSRSHVLWQKCGNRHDFSNALFVKSAKSLMKQSKSITAIESHANKRIDTQNVHIYSVTPRIEAFRKAREDIDKEFDRLQFLNISTGTSDPTQMCEWAEGLIEQETITKLIIQIHEGLAPGSGGNPLIDDLLDHMQGASGEILCGWGHSAYDYLHSIYNLVVVTEMRAFILEAYLNHLLYEYNGRGCKYSKANSASQVKILRERLQTHVKDYTDVFSERMYRTSKEFQNCGDRSFLRDETYFELEGVVQGFMQPLDIEGNDETRAMSCRSLSQGGSDETHPYCFSQQNQCPPKVEKTCPGYLRDCKIMSKYVTACVAEHGPTRYEWIQESNSQHQSSTACKSHKYLLEHPCFCTCVDNTVHSFSTHLINLQPVEADVAENMILTGVRFIVQKRVLQLQIQQGKFGKDWRIDGKPEWKPIDDISEKIRAKRLRRKLQGEDPEVEEGRDYFIVSERTQFNFDQLTVSFGHVLTGVKFDMVSDENSIQIAILSRPFNITSGELSEVDGAAKIQKMVFRREKWSYPTDEGRVRIVPELDKAVTLNTTGQDSWRQGTVPYFDAAPLVSDPPTALGGFGIFHRYRGNTPGIISPKFISMDYTYYMEEKQYNLPSSVK